MATAQAAVLVAPRQVEMQEFTLPEIGDDDGLLKIEITGVCGADWAPYLGDTKTCSPPVILGHEIVGRVERIGAKAAARWGVKEGDRVCMEEYIPCRDCEYCLTGHYNVCGKRWYGHLSANEGPGIWGGYSQYLYLDPKAVVYPMSDKVPVEIAQLFLSMGNGVRWVQSAGAANIGSVVAILGPGHVGMGAVVAAKEAGADCVIVTGLGSDASRLAVARDLGADYTINVQEEEDLRETVRKITGGHMCDTVVNATANAPRTAQQAVELGGHLATIVLAGGADTPFVELNQDMIRTNEMTLKGVRGRHYQEVKKAIQIIESGKYPLHKIATHYFPLEETDLALRTMGREGDPNSLQVSVLM